MRDELIKVTLNLRKGDPERLREHFPQFSYGAIVRKLVSDYVDRLDVQAAQEVEEVEVKI